MHSSRELNDESVKVTWCACENCSSVGPRIVTLVKHHREYLVSLDADCCTSSDQESLVSGETEHLGRHQSWPSRLTLSR
jgi:hypothetical protein